jgi:hypothetical protein
MLSKMALSFPVINSSFSVNFCKRKRAVWEDKCDFVSCSEAVLDVSLAGLRIYLSLFSPAAILATSAAATQTYCKRRASGAKKNVEGARKTPRKRQPPARP